MSLWDDLQDVETKQAILDTPKKRKNEWNNAASFTDGGYLARVLRQTCKSCGGSAEHLQGIFHLEIAPNGTRRLQALGRGAQWPLVDGLPLEVEAQDVDWCPACLRSLGFSRETPAPGVYSLIIQ